MPAPRPRAEGDPAAGPAKRSATTGPQLISRDVLEGYRRQRAVVGLAQLAHKGGGAGMTLAQIVRQGRMSRKTFYTLFADKAECLDFACESTRDHLVAPIRDAVDQPGQWPEPLERAIGGLLEAAAEEPLLAEFCLVHAPTVSPRGNELGPQAVVETLAAALEEGWAAQEGAGRSRKSKAPPELAEFVAAATVSAVTQGVRRGETAELKKLTGELTSLMAELWSGRGAPVAAP